MTTYQPKPGDIVHVTQRGVVLPEGDAWYPLAAGASRPSLLIFRFPLDAAPVVRVEPAPPDLPTGWGARIRATVTCGTHRAPVGSAVNVLLIRAGADSDRGWLARQLKQSTPESPCCYRYADGDLSDVVVLDPGEPT